MSLVSLLVFLIIACVVIWAARALTAAFGIGDPIRTVIYVVLVLIIVLWIASSLGVVGGPRISFR